MDVPDRLVDDAPATTELLLKLQPQLDGVLFHEVFKLLVTSEQFAMRVVNALLERTFDLTAASDEEQDAAQKASDFLLLLTITDWDLRYPSDSASRPRKSRRNNQD